VQNLAALIQEKVFKSFYNKLKIEMNSILSHLPRNVVVSVHFPDLGAKHPSHMFRAAPPAPSFRLARTARQPIFLHSSFVENPASNESPPQSLPAKLATPDDCVGVLLLNLGGPETLEDVQPFLYNLFADPDIIRLPPSAQFLQPAIAQLVSTLRAPKSREGYEAIGGGSPLRKITQEQATALQDALARKGAPARTYVAMRYWKPFTGTSLFIFEWIFKEI
jgi:Ferrochelatase